MHWLAVLAVAGVLSSTSVLAQGHDGEWRGRIECDPLPGATGRSLAEITMRVAGGRATYESVARLADGLPGTDVERGGGPVSTIGQITLTGRAAAFRATYEGRITGTTIRLTGDQIWTIANRAMPFRRGCDVNLTRQ